MTFIYPLFTDQGPLIATAFVLQGGNQIIEEGEGEELERTLKLFLNVMICIMHFIRGTFHHSAKSIKCWEKVIQLHIQNATRSHTQHDLFEEILIMVVEILPRQQEVGTTISDAINVALYILKVDPSHWSTFARISAFDRESFELELSEVLHNLLYIQHFCSNCYGFKHTARNEADFVSRLIEDSFEAATNNTINFISLRKPIVRSNSVQPYFFTFTTNGSKGMASGANYSGVRLASPSGSLDLLLETHQKQVKKLTKQYSTSVENQQNLTSIGWNIVNSLRGQTSPDPIRFTTSVDDDELTTLS